MRFHAFLGLATVLAVGLSAQTESPPPQPEGADVLTRGPVHEAFAEPGQAHPEPTPLVAKQPPGPIEEAPPDQKPEGNHVQWLPGYWSYDEEAQDYLWVSGFWRDVPPGRRWVPGNWQAVDGGWHWVSGLWAAAGQQEAHYLPAPPPTIDRGASVPAPDETSTYAPGCWVYRESRFLWRPGFWVAYQPNWIWTHDRYVWTPAGCVFVDGYWDHPLESRGLLFAPVRIASRYRTLENWSYTPRYVIQPDFLMGALFARPTTCHYYFGDYFAQGYLGQGYVPWIDYHLGGSNYDPMFSHYRHQFAGDPGWERNVRALYVGRRQGDVPRPPHTLLQQTQLVQTIAANRTTNVSITKNINITNVQNVTVLAPLNQMNNVQATGLAALARENTIPRKPLPIRMVAVPREQAVQERKDVVLFREAAQRRGNVETQLLVHGSALTKPQAVKVELPKAPVPSGKPTLQAPPPPAAPKHEVQPIPKHEPPRPPMPPRQVTPATTLHPNLPAPPTSLPAKVSPPAPTPPLAAPKKEAPPPAQPAPKKDKDKGA